MKKTAFALLLTSVTVAGLDRYAPRCANFVPVVFRIAVLDARPSTMLGTALSTVEGRSAPEDTGNRPWALPDITPRLRSGCPERQSKGKGRALGWFAQGERQSSAAQPADRFVNVSGLRIHYLDWGGEGKPPLVMVHGLDRVARTFDHLARRFTSRYRVIAVDMRGHGDSGWDPQGRYLVEDHVGDLEGVVQQLTLRNLVLWGNSTGGRVVQVFAGRHPDLVSHVISEDVGPERPRQIADNYAKRVQQERAGWASEEELLAQVKKANPRMSADVLEAYVRYGARKRPDGRIEWKRDPQLVKGFVATDLWRFVRDIKAPILYILGGRSTIVPLETQNELRKALPLAQQITIPDVGHYPSDEQPEEVVRIVNRFLAGEKVGQ